MARVIGICAALERARWGAWNEVATMVPRSYPTAVQRAGALALLLPPDDAVAQAPDDLLDRVDGLILSGGSDLDPVCYGARLHPETGSSWPERDRFELALAHRALERDIPVLGVCRGMQLLNVACGGTLLQHLPDSLGHERHAQSPGAFGDHDVRLASRSLAEQAAGGARVSVKSHHHQGVDELGEGLVATGWSEPDGLVEAVEAPDRIFALGVQWHPEEDVETNVIAALVAAAKRPARPPALPKVEQFTPGSPAAPSVPGGRLK